MNVVHPKKTDNAFWYLLQAEQALAQFSATLHIAYAVEEGRKEFLQMKRTLNKNPLLLRGKLFRAGQEALKKKLEECIQSL